MNLRNVLKIEGSTNRVYGLDILRAIAILSVVWEHGSRFVPVSIYKDYARTELDGVSIFFVLSGFLIGGILIKIIEPKGASFTSLLNFWIRRWFRTLPNYFLVLIVLTLISLRLNAHFNVLQTVRYYIFLQNFESPHPSFFGEAWSLSIEEWFYIITPVLILVFITLFHFKPKTSILVIAIFIMICVTAFRYYRFSMTPPHSMEQWDSMFRKQVITRLDSLMFGVIGAYLSFYYRSVWIKYKRSLFYTGIALLLVPVVFVIPVTGLYGCVFSFTLISIGTLLLLPFLSELKRGKGFIYRAVTHISLISYSMYLINYTFVIGFLIDAVLGTFVYSHFHIQANTLGVMNYFLFWFFTIVLSTLLYKYFEKPVMEYRDKIRI